MKTIIQALMEQIYIDATELSRKNNQVVGEKNEYYITLEQLQMILEKF